MTAKKRRPRRAKKKNATATSTALALPSDVRPLPPPPVVHDATGMYVKLPISPELVAVGRELVDQFLDANVSARKWLETLGRAADEVERAISRPRRPRRKRAK